jgi:uncharacterized membrane protein YkvA (DUF1232 family)
MTDICTNNANNEQQDQNEICPICQDVLTDACETSCGHFFCGKCLIDYWNSLPSDAPKKCPLDRRVVTFVIPSYDQRQKVNQHHHIPGREQGGRLSQDIDAQLYRWNRILNNQAHPLYDVRENVHLLHRFYEGSEEDNTIILNKFILFFVLLLVILYIISPMDLIPDTIPVIGLLDELFFPILTFLFLIPRLYRLYLLTHSFAQENASFA